FNISSPSLGEPYVRDARNLLEEMDRRGVCGWVVDLRYDGGGNMWPMLNGVSGLFDDGVLGYFDAAEGRFSGVRKNSGIFQMTEGSDTPAVARHEPPLHKSGAPVAVLIGPSVFSAGEFTTIAFEGRPVTRFFGHPTGGFVTVNRPMPLSDGAEIIMSTGW